MTASSGSDGQSPMSRLGPTSHTDTFARDHLPPVETWPEINLGEFTYPDHINVGHELSDAMVDRGFGDNIALIGNGRRRTYKELAEWTNKIAHVLVEDLGIVPGNRILIRSPNTPAMVACWLAASKVGAVVVNTMPMLRAGELAEIIDKAQICLALCDERLLDEMEKSQANAARLKRIVAFDGTANLDAELDRLAVSKPATFKSVDTGRDDVALLAFTSGTTGEPKATMHFHRDLLIIADGYAREILRITSDDVCVGSPPLAFTFGLGGIAVFPLRFGAAAVLLEKAGPKELNEVIETYKATICFTAPTAYRVMLAAMTEATDFSSLRVAVSAGETLPAPIYNEWIEKTGKPILDGIGATELLHVFISNRFEDHMASSTGKMVTGYEAKIIDRDGNDVPIGEVGRLAVRGPTGCRYLDDPRQSKYVQDGWNITGDSFWQDEDGLMHFAARNDDMIVSSGYNIAAPEVEAALLSHLAIAECGVIGIADAERGAIVEAHVVLNSGFEPSAEMAKELQDHVKQTIAPFKYPRSVQFRDALPKTATGKIQRFALSATKK